MADITETTKALASYLKAQDPQANYQIHLTANDSNNFNSIDFNQDGFKDSVGTAVIEKEGAYKRVFFLRDGKDGSFAQLLEFNSPNQPSYFYFNKDAGWKKRFELNSKGQFSPISAAQVLGKLPKIELSIEGARVLLGISRSADSQEPEPCKLSNEKPVVAQQKLRACSEAKKALPLPPAAFSPTDPKSCKLDPSIGNTAVAQYKQFQCKQSLVNKTVASQAGDLKAAVVPALLLKH